MKIFIGKYSNWVGPYQIADILQKFGFSEDYCYDLGKKLSGTWIYTACNWFESKKKRKIKIKLHRYDTWGMDHTLALIIVPMLKQLKATNHGYGMVDKEDVPESLHGTYGTDQESFYSKEAWDWVMDEMIWAFEQIEDSDSDSQFFDHSDCDTEDPFDDKSKIKIDKEGLKNHRARVKNGTILFGKYYQSLWD